MRGDKSLVIVLLLSLFAFQVFADDISLIRPLPLNTSKSYKSNDDLTYKICLDGNLSSYLTCNNKRYNPTCYDWADSCKMCSYDLGKLSCENVTIRLTNEDTKLKKTIFVEFVDSLISKVSSTQKGDESWNSDASDTAFAVFILSFYNERYSKQVRDGLHWLKINRDNENKCWPKGNCDISETVKTLAYLSMAKNLDQYNNTARLMHDSRIWVEDKQSYLDESDWSYTLTVDDDNTTCIYHYSALGSSTSYTLDDNETQNDIIDPEYKAYFNVTCDDDVNFHIYDNNSYLIYTNDGDDDFYYQIPGACWSNTAKWKSCNRETSLYGFISNITQVRRELVLKWVSGELKIALGGRYLDTDNDIKDTALYLKYSGKKQEIIDWLVFKQNNDGSWGSGDVNSKIIPTSYAVFALQDYDFGQKSEVMSDGLTWIYNHNLNNSWHTLEKRGITALQLKNYDDSSVKVIPAVLNITLKNSSFRIFNPSNVKYSKLNYTFPDFLQLFAEKELVAFSYNKINVITKISKPGTYYGNIIIKENNTELAYLPVVLKIDSTLIIPEFNFELFGDKSVVSLNVKRNDDFSCNIIWDAHLVDSYFDVLSDTVDVIIEPLELEDNQYEVNGNLTCKTNDGAVSKSVVKAKIEQHEKYPFTVTPQNITTTLTKTSILSIKNNGEEPIRISISFKDQEDFFSTEFDIVTVETKKAVMIKPLIEDVNITTEYINSIILKSDKYSVEIPFIVTSNRNLITGAFILGKVTGFAFSAFYVLIFGLLLFGGYKYRTVIVAKIPKSEKLSNIPYIGAFFAQKSEEQIETNVQGNTQESVTPNTKEGEMEVEIADVQDVLNSDIDELVEISRGLNILLSGKDEDLKEELKKDGLSEEEIEKDFGKKPFD